MKRLIFAILIALISLQCTNNKPLPNGYELVDRDGKSGLMPPVTLKAVRTATFRTITPVGSTTTLLLGAHQGLSSWVVLNTRNFRSSKIDTTTDIQTMELHMFVNALTDSALTFPVTFHQIEKSWSEYTVIADSLTGSIAAEPLFRAEIQPKRAAWTVIPLPEIAFFKAWIKDAYAGTPTLFGLALKTQSDAMIQFASADDAFAAPFIKIRYLKTDGNQDSVNVALSADAALLSYKDVADRMIYSPPSLRVGSGSGYRSLVQFDLSSIPASATVHQALLTFAVNNDSSRTRVNGRMNISVLAVDGDSAWADAADISVIPTASKPYDVAVDIAQTFSFDDSNSNLNAPVLYVSRTVQRWLTGAYGNDGFLLYPTDEGKDWQEMFFYSGVEDPQQSPTLTVLYSLPTENRFSNP